MPDMSLIYADKKRMAEIEDIAENERKSNGLPTFFDLIKFLTEQKGYEVQQRQISDDTTGLLFIDETEPVKGTRAHNVIVINERLVGEKDYEQKRRFICAHEYGHAVLHKKTAVQFARRETQNKDTQEEQEAEYFAYCFLLPREKIELLLNNSETRDYVEKLKNRDGISTGAVVARLFNVTPKKANERLKQLGYGAN